MVCKRFNKISKKKYYIIINFNINSYFTSIVHLMGLYDPNFLCTGYQICVKSSNTGTFVKLFTSISEAFTTATATTLDGKR